MTNLSGEMHPLKTAFGRYMKGWFDSLYGATPGVQEYIKRGFPHGVQWAPGRMVDQVESMLAAYQKNDNQPQGKNTKLPVVIAALAKDFTPAGAEWGRQQARKLVSLEPGGSVYGYRQAMIEKRAQIVIFSAEEPTANSLAAQFCLYIGEIANRSFQAENKFGQYTFNTPVQLESPDVVFMSIANEQKNLTILAADLTLRSIIPYFDAPREGEENDGSGRNPPGYPVVGSAEVIGHPSEIGSLVDSDGASRQ